MEIVSSNSESAGDEDEDQHNQHRSKKPAAITSRQPKRAPKSPVLDVSSFVSIKQKLKSIMDNLGALPLVEDQLEVTSGQITAEQQLFVAINEEITKKKKKRTAIEDKISEVRMPQPPAHATTTCTFTCVWLQLLAKKKTLEEEATIHSMVVTKVNELMLLAPSSKKPKHK